MHKASILPVFHTKHFNLCNYNYFIMMAKFYILVMPTGL